MGIMAALRAGRAYGCFDCGARKEEIDGELPALRQMAQTQPAVGLSLVRVGELRGDGNVDRIRNSALEAGHKFAIVASYPGASNVKAADELADLLNAAYATPLYEGGVFKGGIAYVDDATGRLMLHD
jgi:hypothetical protein